MSENWELEFTVVEIPHARCFVEQYKRKKILSKINEKFASLYGQSLRKETKTSVTFDKLPLIWYYLPIEE